MAIFISHNVEQTIQLGIDWAKEAKDGMVFGLIGELGCGKTQIVKGLAKGLGINQQITSPTFAIVNEYKTETLWFVHIDLYRLNGVDDIHNIGLDEFLNDRAVVAIEWAEKWFGILDKNSQIPDGLKYRQAILTAINESERKIEYEDFGN